MKKLFNLLLSSAVVVMVLTVSAIAFATPSAPTQPDATTCTECQSIQDDIDSAYTLLDGVIADISTDAASMEDLMDLLSTEMDLSGDSLETELADMVTASELETGTACEDSANSFSYYSQFTSDGTLYCFGDKTQYDTFFDLMMTFDNDYLAGENNPAWLDLMTNFIEYLTDTDTDYDDVEDIFAWIDELIALLETCEDTNCPAEVICPDCEAKEADLMTAMDELDTLEADAQTLDEELTAIETDLDEIYQQLDAWEELRADFEGMVEDAGGMHGADCDGFEVGPGQAWGIAHNFGDVQFCFTNEGQIEEMIQNLDEYWQTHNSQHLPSEADLNQQLNNLVNSWVDKLTEYNDVLDLIEAKNLEIDLLIQDLLDCLAELAALQDQGYCLDQDAAGLQGAADDARADLDEGWMPAEPSTQEEGLLDAAGHWAEEFINELFEAGVVSGDEGTNNFRPNDPINRAEASKVVTLANGDEPMPCDSFFDVFTDVEFGNWFCPYVNTAYEKEYFQGYPDGTFGPALPILRGEAAAVVLRVLAFDVPEYETYSFPDITGDEWYADYAEKSYKCGIFEGRTVGEEKHFDGGENITRAEFAKIVDLAIFNKMTEETCAE